MHGSKFSVSLTLVAFKFWKGDKWTIVVGDSSKASSDSLMFWKGDRRKIVERGLEQGCSETIVERDLEQGLVYFERETEETLLKET